MKIEKAELGLEYRGPSDNPNQIVACLLFPCEVIRKVKLRDGPGGVPHFCQTKLWRICPSVLLPAENYLCVC
jgi:hypothetical protein